jgi:hypothetical protein
VDRRSLELAEEADAQSAKQPYHAAEGLRSVEARTSRVPRSAAEPLPPVRPSQIPVAGPYRVVLPLPGADDECVVMLNSHNPPELLDQVRRKVAVGCGLGVSAVGAGVQGAFLLSVA